MNTPLAVIDITGPPSKPCLRTNAAAMIISIARQQCHRVVTDQPSISRIAVDQCLAMGIDFQHTAALNQTLGIIKSLCGKLQCTSTTPQNHALAVIHYAGDEVKPLTRLNHPPLTAGITC